MSLFRRRSLDRDVEEGLRQARSDAGLPARSKVLAAAPTGSGWCVLTVDALAHNDGAPQWVLIPWHTIERGGFNGQGSTLQWTLVDGRRGSVFLDEPGRLPEVFRERVEATIVLEEHVPIEGTRQGGVVSARRDLTSAEDAIEWRTRRGRGTPDTPEVEAALQARLEALRGEYA
ncbi:hypothetical protein [Mariniluteicoccus flavus]